MRSHSILLGLAAALAPGAALADNPNGVEAGPIVLDEREPLPLLVKTPTQESGRTSISDLISMVTEVLARHTDFSVKVYESSALANCKYWPCYARLLRPDADAAANTPTPAGAPRFALFLTSKAAKGAPDRVEIALLDLETVIERMRKEDKSSPRWEMSLSGSIEGDKRVLDSVRGEVENVEAAREFLIGAIERDLRETLEKNEHWDPWGGVEIEGAPEGATIFLEGTPIGAVRSGLTQIERVRPGDRQLQLEHPGYVTWKGIVPVRKGPPSRVTVAMERQAGAVASSLRTALFWTGLGVAAVGVGITTYAGVVSADASEERPVCIASQEKLSSCGGTRWVGSGFPGPNDSLSADPNTGVPLAPIGLSLAVTGGLWTLGAAIFSDAPELPWKEAAIGLGLGAASFVAMVLANPDSPFPDHGTTQGLLAR